MVCKVITNHLTKLGRTDAVFCSNFNEIDIFKAELLESGVGIIKRH